MDVPRPGEATVHLDEGGRILEGREGGKEGGREGGREGRTTREVMSASPRSTLFLRILISPHPSFLPSLLPLLLSFPPLSGVKARHLETALPAVGGVVLLLRGPHRLQRGKLLGVEGGREEGMVQLVDDDLQVVRMPLDDMAEYRRRD